MPVETGPLAAGPAHPAELDAERQLVAVEGLQRLADQHLVVAHSIEVAGVEQGDPALDGHRQRSQALAPIGRAINIRPAHAAEAAARKHGALDRKSVVKGKEVTVRVDTGGSRLTKKK